MKGIKGIVEDYKIFISFIPFIPVELAFVSPMLEYFRD